jgi:hypothetical protein
MQDSLGAAFGAHWATKLARGEACQAVAGRNAASANGEVLTLRSRSRCLTRAAARLSRIVQKSAQLSYASASCDGSEQRALLGELGRIET